MGLKIAMLVGSVRRDRQGIKAARFVERALTMRGHEVSVVDPVELQLPLLDRMYKEYAKGQAPQPLEMLATVYRAADAFVVGGNLDAGKRFYADVKGRAERIGRSREAIKILPGAFVIVGDTVEEARAKRATLDSLVYYESGIASLSIALGHDASAFDPEAPLPEQPSPAIASQISDYLAKGDSGLNALKQAPRFESGAEVCIADPAAVDVQVIRHKLYAIAKGRTCIACDEDLKRRSSSRGPRSWPRSGGGSCGRRRTAWRSRPWPRGR